MDFGLTVAMRFYLWPFWHQFSLIIYLLIAIIFTIAAMKKASAMRKRRKIFEKLELSMLQERKDDAATSEQVLNYEETLQNQLSKQGIKLEGKPAISRFLIWQSIILMILMNIVNIWFGINQATSELKKELAPEQKRSALQQYGVEFDEDKDVEIPFIDYIGKIWATAHVQNVWVFDIIFILIVLFAAASGKEYWREAWRLVKLRKLGIIAFYIFMLYITAAILDSIAWRDLKADDFGNIKLVGTGETKAVKDSQGNVIRPEANQDIEKLPKYMQTMIGDPILEKEKRSLLDRIFWFWSEEDEHEQGYSEPFARYTLNKMSINDFRHSLFIDVPVKSPDIKISLNSINADPNIDIDIFLRWGKPVVINHGYKPIKGKFVKAPWDIVDEKNKFYKPKNEDRILARWWDNIYKESVICDISDDGEGSFTSINVTQVMIDEYMKSFKSVEENKNKTYARLYICLVAWNSATGQPAILDLGKLKGKEDSGLIATNFSGQLKFDFAKDFAALSKTERDKTGSTHLKPGQNAQIVFPHKIRENMPVNRYHILGTSKVGRDTLFESMKGIRTGIIIGMVTTMIAIPFALLFGIVAGYFGGWIDDIIVYIYSVLGNIPSILLIAAFVMLFEKGIFQLCLIMGITSWVGLCRLLRGETYKLREMEYVQAAEAFGVSKYKIILRHLTPNVLHIVMISAILRFSGLVMAEVMLTYLQIGVGKGSWGKMIVLSRQELARDPAVWWPMTAAFILMLILILAANLFGDAVRDALDPRLRTQ